MPSRGAAAQAKAELGLEPKPGPAEKELTSGTRVTAREGEGALSWAGALITF